jgi:hypothetical protein
MRATLRNPLRSYRHTIMAAGDNRRRRRARRAGAASWLGIALIAAVAGVILGSRHAGHGPPVAASSRQTVSQRKPKVSYRRLAQAAPLDLYAHDRAGMIGAVARKAPARVYVPTAPAILARAHRQHALMRTLLLRPRVDLFGPAVAAGLLAALLVWLGPPGTDLAAHVYQRTLFLEHGYVLWNNFWYAGRYSFVN